MQGLHFLGYVAQYYTSCRAFLRRCDGCGGDHDSDTDSWRTGPIAYSILAREARGHVGTSDGRGKDHQSETTVIAFVLGGGGKEGGKALLGWQGTALDTHTVYAQPP